MQAILAKKKTAQALNAQEIQSFIQDASSSKAHDAQIGAMLMAIAINGMTKNETYDLTSAMIKSGKQMEWPGLVADKHSTGGVGDKVSIPLVPILAELGLTIPMISGRSLEFTGGTLDKLESIPGFNVCLTPGEMKKCLDSCGCFIAATTHDICPADKKIYSIRDITSTVDCTPLVTASILSKKISEGAKYLVQDIKVGEAAFYKDIHSAEELAKSMIVTADAFGLKAAVLLTEMDFPIGRAVGNSLEILECIDILKGKHFPEDLMELILELGGKLLQLTGLCLEIEEAKGKMLSTITSGKALQRFEKMLLCQGVSEEIVENLCMGNAASVFTKAKYTTEFKIDQEGYISKINALTIGKICFEAGSGRKIPTDVIDPSVGCEILVSQGEHVETGQCWAVLHHNLPLRAETKSSMDSAIIVSPKPVLKKNKLIKTLEIQDCD